MQTFHKKIFNHTIFNRGNIAEISLMLLLDLCFVLAFISAFYFIAQKIIEILIYVAQISEGDALALTRSATDPYVVIPLYVYLSLLVFSLSAIWIIFQGVNWWIAKDIVDKSNDPAAHHSVSRAAPDSAYPAVHDNSFKKDLFKRDSFKKDSFLKFMLKFAGVSIIWLFFVFLTITATISLLVANFASQIISISAILALSLIAIIFFSYFYISTLREIRNSFFQITYRGFINSFAWKYLLKFLITILLLGIFSYTAYFFMQNYLFVSILFAFLIIVSLSYFRIIMNLE